MPRISGPQRVMFSRRLGKDWRDLATYLEIPDSAQGFSEGAEGQDILTLLEQRGRIDEVVDALNGIGRSELAEILQPPPDLETVIPNWPGRPYPGLCAFSSEEAPIFCGRDRHAHELVERLKDPNHRFAAVVGASGSGKSSVVAAGVLPRLQQGAIPGSTNWIVLELTPGGPGHDPFHALSIRLEPWLRHQRLRARDIDRKLRVSGGLSELVQHALGHRDHAELVLFIDQFEELFTLCDESYRQPFINMLFQAASIPRLRLIVTGAFPSFRSGFEQSQVR
ncbi:nSTAND1 domain-containing NTPase, partial [Candidatus Entotheonella palauensis]|uniref:nSTAND1 domain-containing NTPase n=1 Tax=Candidatus Entotheonella palauensis TaxID=93172 RepID=UPI003FA44E39